MSQALDIVKDTTLTYNQQVLALARLGESLDNTIEFSDEYLKAKKEGALCDLNEGKMPYRPRYICPDYELLFEKGCEFLELDPPKDLLEAVNVLEIFYSHVPSVTAFPVYLGDIQSDKDACDQAGVDFIWAAYGYGTSIDSYVAKIDDIKELDQVIA